MVIFHSYVSLPEGNLSILQIFDLLLPRLIAGGFLPHTLNREWTIRSQAGQTTGSTGSSIYIYITYYQ